MHVNLVFLQYTTTVGSSFSHPEFIFNLFIIATMDILYSLLGATLLITLVASRTDLTLEPKAKGVDVTDACLRKMKRSGVFPEDHSFMRRCALVESSFGDKEFTYRDKYFGGIWQLDQFNFEKTKNSTLNSYHAFLFNNWGINWTTVTWKDCLKPFYSALATRLYFLSLGSPLPGTVEEQASANLSWYFDAYIYTISCSTLIFS
jgi:hypothetical protein